MYNFYHVTLVPRPGVDAHEVLSKLDLAADWIQYHQNCWIIFTNKDANRWYNRLEPFAKPGGELLICKLDIADRQGWTNKDLWKWIEAKQVDGALKH